jgi:hypothetical protein
METIRPNYKMNWYNAHKDDDDFMQRMRDNKRRYYLNNKEKIKARNLNHYYEKKAQLANEPVTV